MDREDIRGVAVRYVRRCMAGGCRLDDLLVSAGSGYGGHGETVDIRGQRVLVSQACGTWLSPPWRFDLKSIWREASRPDRQRIEQASLFA